MLLNLLINFYVLRKLIYQNEYKKIKLKLKHKTAGSANITNFV